MPTFPAILITGASRRLGRSMAMRLAKEGYAVALHYHSSEADAQQVKRDIESEGGVCELFRADLSQREACIGLIEDVYRCFPGFCGVINNASIFNERSLLDTDETALNAYLGIHVAAPFWLTQHFARMVKTGNIINLLDTDIRNHSERFFTYILSKRMLAELTSMSARALAPAIRVNAIAPGKVLPSVECDEAYLAQKRAQLPMKSLPTPADIADAVVLLLNTPYLIGHTLFIDGGERLL